MKKINWTGQKFYKLQFLNKTETKSSNKFLWNALCDCGNITQVIPDNVKRGNTTSCGQCSKPKQSKDWSGIKRDSLTFIKPHLKNKNEQIIWEAHCDCGKIIYTLPCNNSKSCGCLAKPAAKERCSKLGKAARKFHPIISSARFIWRNNYKRDGDIDFDTFYKLSQLPCDYCGAIPSNQFIYKKYNKHGDIVGANGLFIYNGLDRVDPTKGHYINNVVPCWYPCNIAKLDSSKDEFLSHIKNIYEHNFT